MKLILNWLKYYILQLRFILARHTFHKPIQIESTVIQQNRAAASIIII